jgi:hypothetical protein
VKQPGIELTEGIAEVLYWSLGSTGSERWFHRGLIVALWTGCFRQRQVLRWAREQHADFFTPACFHNGWMNEYESIGIDKTMLTRPTHGPQHDAPRSFSLTPLARTQAFLADAACIVKVLVEL